MRVDILSPTKMNMGRLVASHMQEGNTHTVRGRGRNNLRVNHRATFRLSLVFKSKTLTATWEVVEEKGDLVFTSNNVEVTNV